MKVFFYSVILFLIIGCTSRMDKYNSIMAEEDVSMPVPVIPVKTKAVLKDTIIEERDTVESSDEYILNPEFEYADYPFIKNYSQFSDTLYVTENCVIFLWPDSLEFEKLRNNDLDNHEKALVERISSTLDISLMLDSFEIKSFYCDKHFISFGISDNKNKVIRRKGSDSDIVLFLPGKEPLIGGINSVNRDDYLDYFNLISGTDLSD